jgi:hypothetical protein
MAPSGTVTASNASTTPPRTMAMAGEASRTRRPDAWPVIGRSR